MEDRQARSVGKALLHRVLGLAGAVALTVLFFLVLPLIQAISATSEPDTLLTTVDTAALPPPPPPPPDEPEPEKEEQEEKPPEMLEEAPPLDLAQLDLALNPGIGEGWFGSGLTLDLKTFGGEGAAQESIFSLADLDQPPRATYQPNPSRDPKTRKLEGTVYVLFVVDADGRVQDPKVHRSSEPAFDRAALAAVKKWRFEPGKRNGQPVQFRMRVPITFPKG
jgi:protein TonB